MKNCPFGFHGDFTHVARAVTQNVGSAQFLGWGGVRGLRTALTMVVCAMLTFI